MDIVWKTLSLNPKSVYQISDTKIATWENIGDDDVDGKVSLLRDGQGSYQGIVYLGENIYSLFREPSQEKASEDLDFLLSKLTPFMNTKSDILNGDTLDKLCECVWKNPSWTAAHIAVHCSLPQAFEYDNIVELVNSQESENGLTPLHVAVSNSDLDMVKLLTELGANVSTEDYNGHTSLHQAVSNFSESNSEIIAVLAEILDEEEKLSDDIEEALTPLIMAMNSGKFDAARIIVANNVLLDVPDEVGRPIHHAFKHDNYLLATEILAKNDRQGFSRCKKYKGTPLHWARSSEMVKMIFKFDYELNTRSVTGHTAVHVMVKKGRNECLVEMLAAGADPEIPDNEGNSPLHTAARMNNVDAIRALIVFNADVNATNNEGLTPRHYAASHGEAGGEALQALHMVGATRCARQRSSCLQGCLPWGKYDGDKMEYPYDPHEECDIVFEDFMNEIAENLLKVCREYHRNILKTDSNQRLERLLCLDGGGSRGIVQIQLLAAIERACDKKVIDCFDWIAGTSAGAINTAIISTGACTTEMRKIFFACTRDLFAGSKPYSGDKLENILKSVFGEKKMMEIERPKIMITSALSNRAPPALHFFRNYKPPSMSSSRIVSFNGRYDKPPAPPDEEFLYRAIRSSTAAPTYFPPKDLFMDGGLVSNNPTTDALTEISEYYAEKKQAGEPVRKLGLVLSLGTGNGPVPAMKDIEVYVPQAVTDIFRVGAHIKAAAHLGEIMLSLVTDSRFRPTDRARAWCNDIGAAFFRLSPTLSMMTDLDETDTSVILKLMWETQVYITNNKHKIDQIGTLLSVM